MYTRKKNSKEFLDNLTPIEAFKILKEGNKRFISNLHEDHDHLHMINQTRDGQHPFAVILSCMDSRTSVELIFDQGLGDLFSVRVAGNVVNNEILASIEYAIKYVGSKLLMVLGHTGCGAIKSAKENVQDGHITGLLELIKPSIKKSLLNTSHDHIYDDEIAYVNVENSLNEIIQRSDIVREMYTKNLIGIVGAVYDVDSGGVDFFKDLTEKKSKKNKLNEK